MPLNIVKVVAAAAVKLLGGPGCRLLMGRPDKGGPDNTSGMPDECDSSEVGEER